MYLSTPLLHEEEEEEEEEEGEEGERRERERGGLDVFCAYNLHPEQHCAPPFLAPALANL